jgi:hypothetical protein
MDAIQSLSIYRESLVSSLWTLDSFPDELREFAAKERQYLEHAVKIVEADIRSYRDAEENADRTLGASGAAAPTSTARLPISTPKSIRRTSLSPVAILRRRRRRLVDAYEILAGNDSVAAATDTQELYVGAKPANRLLLHVTAMSAHNADLAFGTNRRCHGFTRMPASRAAAMNARRAVSGGRLPELTSEHARSADRRLSPRLLGHRLSKKLPHDRTSEMTV